MEQKEIQAFDAAPAEERITDEPANWKEKQYEKLRGKLSVKVLDAIIIALVLAFIAVVVIGFMQGHQ